MVSKCHNPRCSQEFRYFGDGKLFEFPPDSVHQTSELYWLCDLCVKTHTVERGPDGEVRLVAKSPGGLSRDDRDAGLERAS
jgi:hypothetical protein